jgi:hypothetical protein
MQWYHWLVLFSHTQRDVFMETHFFNASLNKILRLSEEPMQASTKTLRDLLLDAMVSLAGTFKIISNKIML